MSVKTLVVFPLLPPEVQEIIAKQCDTFSLLALSSVNKSAFDYLPNVDFFQEHYFKQHPLLKPYDKLYTVLLTTHQSNCWKVLCKVMDAQWGSMEKPFATRVSPEFIQEAQSKVAERINAQIKEWEVKNKAICGSYFQDPTSPIDKTWKEFERCARDGVLARKQYNDLANQMQEEVELEAKEKNVEVNDDQLLMVVIQFGEDNEAFVSSSYEEFLEKDPEANAEISRDLFALYQKMIRGSLTIDFVFDNALRLQNQSYQLSSKYSVLENNRKNIAAQITTHKQKLSEFQSNPAEKHLAELTGERYQALMLERNLKSKESLDQCLKLVKKLSGHPEEQTQEALEQVQGLINACHDDYRIRVWRDLYFQCANGAIEESWSEKHFMDHLPVLKSIVNSAVWDAEAYVHMASSEYMSKPPKGAFPEFVSFDSQTTTVG